MGCHTYQDDDGTVLTICSPSSIYVRTRQHCPTCERRRRFVGLVAYWYDTIWTCLACGDSWGDGERLTRPFKRAWRKEATTRARRNWDAAVDRNGYRKWLSEQTRLYRAA